MMPRLLRQVQRFLADRRGATALEYGLIVSLVVIAIIAAMVAVGTATGGMWNMVSTRITRAT
jgi:pilus assembly protein Flp/PilA